MSVILGLLLGLGVYLVWLSFWPTPDTPKTRVSRESRISVLLRQADVRRFSPRLFYVLSLVIAMVFALVIWAVTGLNNLALIVLVLSFFFHGSWWRNELKNVFLRFASCGPMLWIIFVRLFGLVFLCPRR